MKNSLQSRKKYNRTKNVGVKFTVAYDDVTHTTTMIRNKDGVCIKCQEGYKVIEFLKQIHQWEIHGKKMRLAWEEARRLAGGKKGSRQFFKQAWENVTKPRPAKQWSCEAERFYNEVLGRYTGD